MRTAPVILASDIVIMPTSKPVVAPTYGMRNLDAVPVDIEQLTFVVTDATVAVPAAAVSLRFRNQPITNGWLPLTAFTTVRNESAATVSANGTGPVSSVVRLPIPITLQPGEWIDVSFSSPLCQSQITAQAFAAGRFAEKVGPRRQLPYFAGFVGAAQDGNSGAIFSLVSSPQDLGNPFNDTFKLTQIVGRVITGAAANTLYDTRPDGSWPPFMLRLSDHLGRYWIPTPTPIHAAINVATRAWPVNCQLARNGFLRAEVEGVATWTNGAGLPAQFAAPVIGIGGYRDLGFTI
jgi:hypothetical protein